MTNLQTPECSRRPRWRWWGYNILFTLVFCLLLPRFLWRMARRGGYRRGFSQRLGGYPTDLTARIAARPRVWIHAVSVGEMYVALRTIDALRTRVPEFGYVVTTNTSTGHAVAERLLDAGDVLLYVPVDLPPIMRRALDTIRPAAVLLVECELWPNLIRLAHGRGIPVMIINGRMSASSFAGYRRLGWVVRPTLAALHRLLVQTAEDAERLRILGADPGRILVTGTAKYDLTPAPGGGDVQRAWLAQMGVGATDPLIVGGSTWPGEEEVLLRVWSRLRRKHPALSLLLAPRHAERGPAVAEAIRAAGAAVLRRSRGTADAPPPARAPAVLLADTTGELAGFYACATVVFVGKSLCAEGGQNFIEPAMLGKAVITGPHLENFADVAAAFRAADAIRQVADETQLEAALDLLLTDAVAREAQGQRAAAVVAAQRGSVMRTAEAVAPVLTFHACPETQRGL